MSKIYKSVRRQIMQTIIVTGATSGIGLSVCNDLIKKNNRVIGISRSREKCSQLQIELREKYSTSEVHFYDADLMQLSEVKRVSDEISGFLLEQCNGELNVLINNAGCVRSWYSTTLDGYEQQFALNHLASFALTHYMMPYLEKGKGKVIMTSSGSHKMMKIHWKDLMYSKTYNPLLAYKQSKLCNMLFALSLNEMYQDKGIKAYGVDPGLVKTNIGNKETGGVVNLVWSLRKKSGVSPDVPAKTYTWLCEQNNKPNGLYFYKCEEKPYSKQVMRGLFILS